jgi:DNA polymerase/3'-5' exonuclease PolX
VSDGTRMSYSFALNLANHMVDILRPDCQRIEIAGSLRRKKLTIGDIEIVLIPNIVTDLFGGQRYDHELIAAHLWHEGFDLPMNGPLHKQAHLPPVASKDTVNFDIYLTDPEKWGVIFTLRTGPAEFSHRLVTPRRVGGYLPSYLKVQDGRVCNRSDDALYDTPEESDFFRVIGLPYIQPEARDQNIDKTAVNPLMDRGQN